MRNLLFRTILAIVLLLGMSALFADTITIGSGTSTTTYMPVYSYYGYTYSQMIYTKAQINSAGGAGGDIQKIRFYWALTGGSLATNKDWVVYMGHTTKTTFSSTTDWVPLASMTQVFSGEVTAPSVPGWIEISFPTAFTYNNVDNIVIAVDENTASYASTSWYAFTSGTNTGIYYRNDSTNPSPSTPPTASGRNATIPQLQLVFPSTVVPGTATSPSPADLATGVFNAPTLTWNATTGDPTSYDVYFGTSSTSPAYIGNQGGRTYAPGTLSYLTDYYWQIVPRNGIGPATGCPIWKFTTGPDPTITLGPTTPYSYGFEGTPFPPSGWLNYKATGAGTYLWTQVATGTSPTVSAPHGGAAMGMIQTYNQTAGTVVALVSPKVVVPGNDYQMSFWMYRDNSSSTSYPNEGVKIYLGSTTTDTLTTQIGYVHRRINGSPTVATEGWYKYTFNFPASSTGDKYLIINSFSDYGYNTYIDDISMQQQPALPLPAIADSPLHNAINVARTATLNWHYDSGGPTPDSYKLYFGQDGDGTSTPIGIENGLVLTSATYTPASPLAFGGVYYWQVVPYVGTTPATGCPIWKFTVMSDPTMIPTATQNFDGVTPPALPAGWTIANVNADAYTWVTNTGNAVSTPNNLYLRYTASGTGPQNDWIFTPPVRLTGGTSYTFEFKYKTGTYVEKTAFCWGNAATVGAMSAPLWTLEASQTTYLTVKNVVVPSTPGANDYYFGWHAYSAEDMGWIYMDDIAVYVTPITPDAAITPSPINAATGVGLNPTFTWVAPPAGYPPTGYKFNLGTTLLAPNDIVGNYENGTSLTYTYSGTPLSPGTTYYWQVVPYNGDGPCTLPTTWSFTTGTIPGAATTPSPADLATDVQRNVTLGWATVSGATSYDVYIGAGATPPTTGAVNVTTNSYIMPSLLLASTQYAWKVVAKNAIGETVSPTPWTFTTGTSIVYPTSTATSIADDDIGQLIFAGIENPAGAPPAMFTATNSNMYTDYTSTVTPGTLMRTVPYSVTMYQTENASTWYECMFKMYIDYNQNGNFDLPDELVFSGTTGPSATPNFPLTGTTTAVPALAPLGLTRLRCVLDESDVANPTGTYSWGETEDYMVNIIEYSASLPPAVTIVSPADLATGVARNATLNWSTTAFANGYTVYFGTSSDTWEITGGGKDMGTDLTYIPEVALDYGQRYYWKVIAYNDLGDGPGDVKQFTVMNDPTLVPPQAFDFEGTFPPTPGWINQVSSGTTLFTTGTSYYHGGSAAAYFPLQSNTGQLITPPISLSSDNFKFSLWIFRRDISGTTPTFNIYTNTTPSTTGATLKETIAVRYSDAPAVASAGWYQYSYNFGAGSAGTQYIIIEVVGDGSWNAWFDDFAIEEIPTNPLLALSKTRLDLPVTPISGGSSDVFTISNAGPGTLTGTISYSAGITGPTTIGTTPFEVEVTYEPTAIGQFIGTVTITTNGGNNTVSVYSNAAEEANDFESAWPTGWLVYDLDANDDSWNWYTGQAHTGTGHAGVYYNSAGNDDWLTTPLYSVVAGDKLTFWAKSQDPSYPEALEVLYSTTGNTPADFTNVLLSIDPIPNVYTPYEINLSTLAGSNVYFAFHDNAVDSYYLWVDDIGMPARPMLEPGIPTNVTAALDEDGYIQLNWDVAVNSTTYKVYYSDDPYLVPSSWTLLTEVSTNSYLDTSANPRRFYMITGANTSKSGVSSPAVTASRRERAMDGLKPNGSATKK